MSEILLARDPHNPRVVGVATKTEPENIPVEDRASQLPQPSGYHILCAIPDIEKEYESGIIKADQTLHYEEVLTTVLFVVAMGPDCYKDEKRFPSGPWCKVGDFILVRPNSGSRLVIHGKEFRLINDDTVEGVVQDPRGIRRK
jgi:co-chaperonin GroES (HSP10)